MAIKSNGGGESDFLTPTLIMPWTQSKVRFPTCLAVPPPSASVSVGYPRGLSLHCYTSLENDKECPIPFLLVNSFPFCLLPWSICLAKRNTCNSLEEYTSGFQISFFVVSLHFQILLITPLVRSVLKCLFIPNNNPDRHDTHSFLSGGEEGAQNV